MNKKSVPPIFFDWVNDLCSALNVRSVPTFLELLIGSMITHTGFINDAQMAIVTKRHWGSYYKWIQQGVWSYLSLARQLLRLVIKAFNLKELFIIFDDTNVPRSSKKAPDVKFHHQHGKKPNRPKFIWGQCRLTMAVALGNGCAIPIVSRLISTTSNTGKLLTVRIILRAMKPVLNNIPTTMLVDSWFMRKNLLLPALELGLKVIGQVRIDTALYALPIPAKQQGRGRPRIYGEKQTFDHFMALSSKGVKMRLYNKEQRVHYRSLVAKARFLKGRIVKVVFCQFEDSDGALSKPRLILSTNTELRAEKILQHYAKRWTIEPMFNQLKNNWGLHTVWQQSRQVLSRWVQIVSLSYALPQMLVHLGEENVRSLMTFTPWRTKHPVTAGRIRLGLSRIFGHFAVRSWWNAKSRKFEPPDYDKTMSEIQRLPKVS